MATGGRKFNIPGGHWFREVKWASRPVVFDRNTGENVSLSENNTVATRERGVDYGVVFTCEPMSSGPWVAMTEQMLRVTVMGTDPRLTTGMGIGFTGERPDTSRLTKDRFMKWRRGGKHFLSLTGQNVSYNGKKLCKLDFHTNELTDGQSVGILLTRGRDLHWFVDDQWRGEVHVGDYPLDELTWGVVDVSGGCKQVRADICTGPHSHSSTFYPLTPSMECQLLDSVVRS